MPFLTDFSLLGCWRDTSLSLRELQNRVGAFVICDLAKKLLKILQPFHRYSHIFEFVVAGVVQRVLRDAGCAFVSREGIVVLDALRDLIDRVFRGKRDVDYVAL